MDTIEEMVAGFLGYQEECIQNLKIELTQKKEIGHSPAPPSQEPGGDDDLEDLFITGKKPPGLFDDIMDLDFIIGGQWSQL